MQIRHLLRDVYAVYIENSDNPIIKMTIPLKRNSCFSKKRPRNGQEKLERCLISCTFRKIQTGTGSFPLIPSGRAGGTSQIATTSKDLETNKEAQRISPYP